MEREINKGKNKRFFVTPFQCYEKKGNVGFPDVEWLEGHKSFKRACKIADSLAMNNARPKHGRVCPQYAVVELDMDMLASSKELSFGNSYETFRVLYVTSQKKYKPQNKNTVWICDNCELYGFTEVLGIVPNIYSFKEDVEKVQRFLKYAVQYHSRINEYMQFSSSLAAARFLKQMSQEEENLIVTIEKNGKSICFSNKYFRDYSTFVVWDSNFEKTTNRNHHIDEHIWFVNNENFTNYGDAVICVLQHDHLDFDDIQMINVKCEDRKRGR